MKNIDQIIKDYTTGEADLDKTNAALAEAEAGFRLEPGRNVLTEEDMRQTVVGYYPDQASGWGLLLTGTGTPEKVHVNKGRLDWPVNEVQPDGSVNSYAQVVICGKVYDVRGDALVEVQERPETPTIPKEPDMRRRIDLAGQTVEQRTKRGLYRVAYDADGYAVRATHISAGSFVNPDRAETE